MSMALKIRMILLEKKMTVKELGERIGTNGNNMSTKLIRDRFTEQELKKIAEALDCDYEGVFTMRDTGKKI